MAKKISQLPAAGALTGAEQLEIVQSGTSKRTTAQGIADLAPGGSSYPTLTSVGDVLIATGTGQRRVIEVNNGVNPNYIEFTRPPFAVRGNVGMLGSPEMNMSFNLDYYDGVHRYYDSTMDAVWMALFDGGWQVQFAPAGQPPGDMWNSSGRKLMLYQTIDGRMIINTDATAIGLGGFDAQLTVPRDAVSGMNLAGDTLLVIEGGKTKGVSAPVYINNYNNGDVHIAFGGGNVAIGILTATAKLDVNGNLRVRAMPEYANRTAAIAGGLLSGMQYSLPISGDNKVVCIV